MGALSLDDCVARPEAGGKVVALARLREAGVRVLPGLVLLPGQVAPLAALQALGARLVVRSSSTVEDLPGRSAAGVFWSEVGVRPEEVTAAVARVRASADSDVARAYGVAGASLAVLIQPLCEADWLGVARRRSDGTVLVEVRPPGEPEWGAVEARTGGPELAALVARVEAVLARAPLDLELASLDGVLTVLQARPSPPSPAATSWTAPGPGQWRLDAEHNPAPLSEAQAGLVALVERQGVGPHQALVGGWLFWQRPSRPAKALSLTDLRRHFDEELAPDCLAVLASVEQGSLASALTAYLHVYARYVGEISPTLRQARAALDELLRRQLGEGLAAHGVLLGGAGGITVERDELLWRLGAGEPVWADYVARFGAYAPAWDVAAPTDDEAEPRVRGQAAAWAGRPRPRELQSAAAATAELAADAIVARIDSAGARELLALLPLVRDAMAVAEDDDRLFFAAQRVVRRALLHRGRGLVAKGHLATEEDVFCLPLDPGPGPFDELVAAAKRRRLASLRAVPPDGFDDGVALLRPVAASALRGQATFGAGRGRALVLTHLGLIPAQVPVGAILIVPALLPSLGHLLPSLAALVTEHGGVTSHGATLAREYGIPAVLGVRGATSIPDGTDVFVDGARGLVVVTA